MIEEPLPERSELKARRVGIDTSQEAVVFLRAESEICRAEGFSARSRVRVHGNGDSTVATLAVVTAEWLGLDEAGLSESAFSRLGLAEGASVVVSHVDPAASLSHVRSKVYGHRLSGEQFSEIIADVVAGHYSDVHLSSFVTACAGDRLDRDEIVGLTRAMIVAGERLDWGRTPVVDKHSVGGLPGNRTTLLIVPIVAAYGLTIPKTSSRAITSPAGSADTMEVLAPVNLSLEQIHRVVSREGGCIVWGGAVSLSPADDMIIRVERVLDIDSEGQMVASVLSKKVAAGSTHVVLDIPVGPTAKVRSVDAARKLSEYLCAVGQSVGLTVRVHVSDGSKPVGRGVGPALEARDALAVLQNKPDAPADLRERGLTLAGLVLETSGRVESGSGEAIARQILEDGRAWRKFQAICEAQGGMREIPVARHTWDVLSPGEGYVESIDNRQLARIARFAGAPSDKEAGVLLHANVGEKVQKAQPLFTIHAGSAGELSYALEYASAHAGTVRVERLR